MRKFTFLTPNSLSEALLLLREHAGRIKPLAGGTDLMVELRDGDEKLDAMDYALDLTALPELRAITTENGLVSIGAMATHNDVATSPVVRFTAAMLAEASASIGAQQIRNAATIGGNVCNAAVAADTLSPLAALDARVTLLSGSGARELPLSEFILGAGKTALQPDELLTKLSFAPLSGWQSRFVKLGRRKALAISRMNAAVALLFEDGVIASARVSPGCVFASPRRVSSAEALLIGQVPSLSLFEACGKAVSDEMVAVTGVRWSTEYKYPALAAIARHALCEAAGLTEAEA
ncbi:MAG TPA: FAD binding domain-containing protein [Candidatus Cryosericum sp.]|nr:FAD binding domain-containing protein [Candidatus Cryosericum sp.]